MTWTLVWRFLRLWLFLIALFSSLFFGGFIPDFFCFLGFFFQFYIISYLEKRKGHRTGDKWWKNYKGFVKAFKERKATGEFVCFNLMYMYMYIFWNFNFINRKITSFNYCFLLFVFSFWKRILQKCCRWLKILRLL